MHGRPGIPGTSQVAEAGDRLPEVRDLLLVLQRRRTVGFLVAAAVMLMLLLFTMLRPPSYTAATRVVLHPVLVDIGTDPATDTQVEVFRSRVIAARAANALGLATPADQVAASIRAEAVTDELVQISVTAARPQLAAALANEVVRQYGAYQRDKRDEELDAAAAQLRNREIELRRRASELGRQADAITPGTPEHTQLSAERDATLAQLGAVQAGLGTVAAAAPAAGIEVVDPARPPDRPNGLTRARAIALGLFAGLFLGVVAAFLWDHLDPRIWGRRDGERAAGLPAIAAIPRVPRWRARPGRSSRSSRLDLHGVPAGTATAYQRLCLGLRARGLGSEVRRVLVVSATPREGASTVTAGLAATCAANGIPTLAVAADVIDRGLERRFGIVPGGPGLADALGAETAAIREWIRPVAPDLWLLPPGRPVASRGELLRGSLWRRVLNVGDSAGRLVLVDAPPLLKSDVAAAIGPWVDAILVVVGVGVARPHAVAEALSALAQVGPMTGWMVLNRDGRRDGSSPVAQAAIWTQPAWPTKNVSQKPSKTADGRHSLARSMADPPLDQ
jgi:capsular polysaccharide biosynthesis protein/Mrp family chromosome partitioning ATPase